MLKNKNKTSELKDLLDSDDELPVVYNEEPETPAYLDDHRFDIIEFNWIKNAKIRSIPAKQDIIPAKQDIIPASIQHFVKNHQKNNSPAIEQDGVAVERNLIKRGILNEQDILCTRGVAARARDDAALLWFIDFLMHKDLQSNYKFLKSCLVLSHENYENSRKLYLNTKNMDGYFELIVK